MKRALVIGAGLGGLAAGCLLAADGMRVRVVERTDRVGGKMSERRLSGFRFDTGPSVLTMLPILQEFFERTGARLQDYLDVEPLELLCRYHFADGTRFDNHLDPERTLREVERIAPGESEAFDAFMAYSKSLYEITEPVFLRNPLASLSDFGSLPLRDLTRIDALRSVSERVDRTLASPHLRQFFKRFTTYNGSNPYQAPATLNVIPHVELTLGAWYVRGGMYRIAEAMRRRLEELGGEIRTGVDVEQISVRNGRVVGLQTSEGEMRADLVVCNADMSEAVRRLLGNRTSRFERIRNRVTEPSSSGLVVLAGANRRWDRLAHHTIFFSGDYKREFDQIFRQRRLAEDPTIYVADTSSHDGEHAPPGGSNLFILINTPYVDASGDAPLGQEESGRAGEPDRTGAWEREADRVLDLLESRGLDGLKDSIVCRQVITPNEFQNLYRSNRGSIYGTSSNSRFSAFMRPRNRHRRIAGLYFCGGSTHPGGGIPLVVLSAFHARELIHRHGDA